MPADAPNTSNTAVVRGLMLHRFPCSVGRVVIDENDLPVEGLQDSLDGAMNGLILSASFSVGTTIEISAAPVGADTRRDALSPLISPFFIEASVAAFAVGRQSRKNRPRQSHSGFWNN